MKDAARRARIAVIVHFLAMGVALGVWASRLPAVKETLRLKDGDIGFALFIAAIGALISLRAAGPVIERYGSRRMTQLAGMAHAIAVMLPAFAQGLPTLALVLLVMGAASSIEDVAMNSQAVAVEHATERPIMSSFHAAFSVGGIAGAGIGAATAKFDVSYRATLFVVGVSILAAVLIANRQLLDTAETQRRAHDKQRDRSPLPHRKALMALGAIGFVSFIAEGAAADWTTIYLREGTGATAATAAVGYVVFSITMTAGRLAGDGIAARYGALPVIRAGTAIAAVALAGALAIGTTLAGFIGFAVLGIGLSVVVPQVFSAAGAMAPARAAAALSRVSAISYLGFLVGPATIGAVSDATSLRIALLIPAALVLAGAVVANLLHVADPRGSEVAAGEAQTI